MKTNIYIDCTSAEAHLNQGERNVAKGPMLDKFSRVFRHGAVKSNCGRMVISTTQALKNIGDAVAEYATQDDNADLQCLIRLTLMGVTENCAATWNGDSFLPKPAEPYISAPGEDDEYIKFYAPLAKSVPKACKYISVDLDGDIYSFYHLPYIDELNGFWIDEKLPAEWIDTIRSRATWKTSLRRMEDVRAFVEAN